MRIRLDTELKTITVEKTTNFGVFMQKIEAILPNGEWKEYDLHIELMANWNDIIYIDNNRWTSPQPNNPWQPWIGLNTHPNGPAYNTNSGNMLGGNNVTSNFNIEI